MLELQRIVALHCSLRNESHHGADQRANELTLLHLQHIAHSICATQLNRGAMIQQSQTILLALCTVHSLAQATFPLFLAEHGFDGNYGGKMMSPIEPIQPVHEMHVPVQWKENSPHDDYYRWASGNKDNFDYRQARHSAEFPYPNMIPQPVGYGHSGVFKYSDHEQGHSIEPENVPITILFKGSSTPIALQQHHFLSDGGPLRHEIGEKMHSHLIHRVTKPVITEIHEMIIAPSRKGNHQVNRDVVQFKEDARLMPHNLPPAPGKFLSGKMSDALTRNYSLMKDKNSHNFGVFNKMYDLSLQMNKANGYTFNGASSHQSSQGHAESDADEPETDASNEESSNAQPA